METFSALDSWLLNRPLQIGWKSSAVADFSYSEMKETFGYILQQDFAYIEIDDCSETALHVLRDELKVYPREKYRIALKLYVQDAWQAEALLRKCLQDSKLQYFDVVICHGINSLDDYETVCSVDGALTSCITFRQKGMIKHIALSSLKPDFLIDQMDHFPFDFVQFSTDVLLDKEVQPLLGVLQREQIPMIACFSAMLRDFPMQQLIVKYLMASPLNLLVTDFQSLANVKILNETVQNRELLSGQEYVELKTEIIHFWEMRCNRCGQCAACPQGINIPFMLMLYRLYHDPNRNKWVQRQYALAEKKANLCDGCGLCESHCNQKIPIPQIMKKLSHLLKG